MRKLALLATLAPLALTACGNIQLADGEPGEQCGGRLNYCATDLRWMPPRQYAKPYHGATVFDEPAPGSTKSFAYLDAAYRCHLIIPFPDTVGYSKRFVRGLIALETENCNRLLEAGSDAARRQLSDWNVHYANVATDTPVGTVYSAQGRQLMANRPNHWRWPWDNMADANAWNQTLFETGEQDFIAVDGPRVTPARWR